MLLESAEQMEPYRNMVATLVASERLSSFLVAEPQTALLLTNAGGQVRSAQRALKFARYEEGEYNDLEGANGQARAARRELVAEEVVALDARAMDLVQRHSTENLRTYLAAFDTAAAMWAALPLYFGGPSQEEQLNVKHDIKTVKYVFGKAGEGARTLHRQVTTLQRRLVEVGGTMSDPDAMQTIIDKLDFTRDGVNMYDFQQQELLGKLNDGTLTTDGLRTKLVAAEKRVEKKMLQEGREVSPDGAMVTSTGRHTDGAFTERQLAEMDRREKANRGELVAMVTKSVTKVFKKSSFGTRSQPKGVCYKFRDTGACPFGDGCRFSH